MARLQREQGVEIHWEEHGEGPPVVLAPYAILHPSVFDPIAAELARDHRVIRYDDRGAGQSTRARAARHGHRGRGPRGGDRGKRRRRP